MPRRPGDWQRARIQKAFVCARRKRDGRDRSEAIPWLIWVIPSLKNPKNVERNHFQVMGYRDLEIDTNFMRLTTT